MEPTDMECKELWEQADTAQWLRGSSYVDTSGKPIIMYHGTKASFGLFRPHLTPDDHVPGISVTPNRREAEIYGPARSVYLRAMKPISMHALEAFAAERAGRVGDEEFTAFDVKPKTLLAWLKAAGYDAIDYTADPMLGYGIRVFDAQQIRPVRLVEALLDANAQINWTPNANGDRQAVIGDTVIDYRIAEDGSAYIAHIQTYPEEQGKGSARKAMQAFLRAADARGAKVSLISEPQDTWVSQKRLDSLYRSFGFKKRRGSWNEFVREPHPTGPIE